MRHKLAAIALAAPALLAACGGGDSSPAEPHGAALNSLSAKAGATAATTASATTPDRRVQAYSADLASQLFTLAEASYPDLLPSKQTTRSFNGWSYRYYPETKIYLAVIDADVYVLGGTFGTEALHIGPITNFIKSTGTGKDRPLTATILALCPDAQMSSLPSFYGCMVGHLTGTQTFDSSKSCRLEITDAGVFTLSSSGTSVSVGPSFGYVSYNKIGSAGLFLGIVRAAGDSSSAEVELNGTTTLSFINGGTLSAEARPAGSSNSTISCRLTVPK